MRFSSCVLFGFLMVCALPGAPAVAQVCVGDLNGDDDINAADLALLLGAWGTAVGPADLNVDAAINAADLALLLGNWGPQAFDCGTFPPTWISGGPDCPDNGGAEPISQVHWYNDDLAIIRQSLCTQFEAPFIYAIFGDEKVLVLDTGAGLGNPFPNLQYPVSDVIFAVVDQWEARNGNPGLEIIISHTHNHGDHTHGDPQFVNNNRVTFVPAPLNDALAFYNMVFGWPNQIVQFDLGNRILDIVPTPGHQTACLTFYDHRTALLLTGDFIYPGRLFVFDDICTFEASAVRLWNFIEDLPVSWVVGCHIEMSNTPNVQFGIGSLHHPDEHPLQLTKNHVLQVRDAATAVGDTPFPPTQHFFGDFIIHVFPFSNCGS